MSHLGPKSAIGLDGGGTKVHAVATDSQGSITGRGRGGACNLAAVAVKKCVDAAVEASYQALLPSGTLPEDVVSICAGLAGASFTSRVHAFRRSLQTHFPNAAITVVPDYATAHYGALDGAPGIIVIAGTGSAAYGVDAAGKTHKSGAYGFRIDDAGSGYGVGRRAIAAVMHAADGTGEATSLSSRVLAELGLSAVSDIVPAVYGDKVDRVTIASLAQIVAASAIDDGDYIATSILAEAGWSLARLVFPILSNLFADTAQPITIATIGSLWNSGESLKTPFAATLDLQSIPWILQEPIHGPAEGAVSMALRHELSF